MNRKPVTRWVATCRAVALLISLAVTAWMINKPARLALSQAPMATAGQPSAAA